MLSASRWAGHRHGLKDCCSGQTDTNVNFIRKIEAEVLKAADSVLLLIEDEFLGILTKGGIRYEEFDSRR